MIPFKTVNSIEEVKAIYPVWCYEGIENKPKVQAFIREELAELKRSKVEGDIKSIALARGVYRFLWCLDHCLDQAIKFGWLAEDLHILIKRMKLAGYDPYSLTEDTAGAFLEALPHYGYKEVKKKDGTTFYAYNPKGLNETVRDKF
ncbi:MAG: hypothetical protein NHB15_03135 [Methanosarcina barkeri]|nr:hypothetical protein [Methanosarcina sp. ERenArc_MAG2]